MIAANPSFKWADFQARARMIFNELQEAWSSLNWERARPHETDNIFQMHQYWIEAYRRFWEASLDRLDDYLQKIQSENPKNEKSGN